MQSSHIYGPSLGFLKYHFGLIHIFLNSAFVLFIKNNLNYDFLIFNREIRALPRAQNIIYLYIPRRVTLILFFMTSIIYFLVIMTFAESPETGFCSTKAHEITTVSEFFSIYESYIKKLEYQAEFEYLLVDKQLQNFTRNHCADFNTNLAKKKAFNQKLAEHCSSQCHSVAKRRKKAIGSWAIIGKAGWEKFRDSCLKVCSWFKESRKRFTTENQTNESHDSEEESIAL